MSDDGASNVPVPLEAVLASREARAARQREALAAGRGAVVSFTVNMPGPVKDTTEARTVFRAGLAALRLAAGKESLALELVSELYPETGPEALFRLEATPLEAKRLTTGIETAHALGRLFDMDVPDANGVPVSRRALALPPRACLLCGNDAAVCARGRAHALDDILAAIREMVAAYKA